MTGSELPDGWVLEGPRCSDGSDPDFATYGIQFMVPYNGDGNYHRAVPGEALDRLIGTRPFDTPKRAEDVTWTTLEAIDALAWLVKRQILEDNGVEWIDQLPPVRVTGVLLPEAGAAQVWIKGYGFVVFIDDDINPIAGLQAFLSVLAQNTMSGSFGCLSSAVETP